MPELLLELLSEEIPARMQERAAADLAELVGRSLDEAELGHERIDAYTTPRRLALQVQGIPARQADVMVERRGPRVGAPQAALDGFIASLGVSDYALEERDDRKGRVHVARYRRAGQPTPDVLVPLLGAVLARFPWPKSMRWGSYGIRWIRPLRGILCLFDGEVVPLEFGPLRAGGTTRGHRFLAPAPIEVRDFEDYRRKLAAAHVQLEPAERRTMITSEAERLARAEGLQPAQRSRALRRSSRGWSNGRSSCSAGSSSGSWSCRRNPDHGDAPSPEVSCAADRGRSPRDALRDGGQSVGQGRRPGHRRGQRTRSARTAVGCPVLLGSGPQAPARQPGAGAGRRGVSRQTRLARCQGDPPRGAGSLAGAVGARRAGRPRGEGRAAVQGRSGHRHGRGVPRVAGHHGQALRVP